MAELLSFKEGSAWVYTGNASALALYVRDISVQGQIGRYEYRPPHSTAYQYVETARQAILSIGQAFYSPTWAKLAINATGGSVIVHLQHAVPNTTQTGGIWLHTGSLGGFQFAGAEGQAEQSFSLRGSFRAWSAY